MQYIVTLGNAIEAIKRTYYVNEGDYYEKSYWPLLKDRFPNCEDYWRHFVVPITRRLQATVTDQRKRTLPREHISEDVLQLASLHYSVFMHLVCCYDHVMNPRMSSFEDFYTHLAAACDLAEEFLHGVCLLTIDCCGGRANVPQLSRKETAQKQGGDRGDSLQTGAAPAVPPARYGLLDEYFGASEQWKEYKLHARKVRDYRDAILRNFQIGRVIMAGDIVLVPRKEHIQDYGRWPAVFLAAEDPDKLQSHFIDMKEQMIADTETLEVMLNNLWQEPIAEMKRLFFDDKNPIMLGKYQITPT
ncbi:MAG: hypothetical protein QUS33_06310 [Dehalococcoidia bacterium]|nr:hypothetical protein [Dehalococcoidia bacterium]